jgi:hypothetical protein
VAQVCFTVLQSAHIQKVLFLQMFLEKNLLLFLLEWVWWHGVVTWYGSSQ